MLLDLHKNGSVNTKKYQNKIFDLLFDKITTQTSTAKNFKKLKENLRPPVLEILETFLNIWIFFIEDEEKPNEVRSKNSEYFSGFDKLEPCQHHKRIIPDLF